ncbi:YheC/YheD family protein [Bacillus sp. HMF5848]|uniref:YheC/YheD family endospore coat-associated protein n=1 Tax=Bacillus sp. HMF5848 TaxID=2495421 RepID=UPI000F78F9FA|nr:YheC/YheD family protein [Bacillus sp. HMF5848]RSK26299.1 YheC/YheD family protein [Bacillus sp. HMF5848]
MYRLKFHQSEKETVFLPSSLYNNEITHISFGTQQHKCKVIRYDSDEKNTIHISRDVADILLIPHEASIRAFKKDNVLHIGPLIGIFTAGFTGSILRPVGERSIFFSKLLSMANSVGVCIFVFGAHQINWDNATIAGYFFTKKGWEQCEVPFPNVIYDRLPNRKTESHPAIAQIKKRLSNDYLIPIYNPKFFNKTEIYELLEQHNQLSQYTPKTISRPSWLDIDQMVKQFGHVFVKPANGSLGLGVFQILYSEKEQAYYCRYRDEEDKNRLQRFMNLSTLADYLFKDRDLEYYVVQQGISLIRMDKNQIDFRVHTNQDENGVWHVGAIAAKVAGRGSVTTHINSGGSVHTLEEVIVEKDEAKRINMKIEEAVLAISEYLSEKMNGLVGEIGFDIGVDREGRIWLFEANAKPGRSIFHHPKLHEADKFTRRLTLEYAIYVMKQSIYNPEKIYSLV